MDIKKQNAFVLPHFSASGMTFLVAFHLFLDGVSQGRDVGAGSGWAALGLWEVALATVHPLASLVFCVRCDSVTRPQDR